MSRFIALMLGILQGLTEFIPVSSSAHLKLAKLLLNQGVGENQVLFDLFCHFGTLIALVAFLRPMIFRLFTSERKKLFILCLSILPLFPAYFLMKPLRDYFAQTHFLGYFLIGTGLLLFAADRLRFRQEGVEGWGCKDALWIGAMQGIALIPGISRSASTITCAKVLGWKAQEAVQFSFLLAVPTVIGGNILEILKSLYLTKETIDVSFSSCLIGFLSSLAIGAAIVRWALRRLSTGRLKPFGWYCILIGGFATIYLNR